LSSFFAILFGNIFLKEKAKKNEIMGMLFGFIGLFFICSEKGLDGNFLGIASLLTASLFYAFGTIQSKRIKVNPFALIIWISSLSVIPFFVGSILMDEPIIDSIVNAQHSSWGIVIFASWGSVLLASTSWLYLVKKYPISTISSFRLLIPVFGLFFSTLFLSEVYAAQIWMGAGIIIIGLILTQLKFKNQLMEKVK
jgi:O-acetylserine/cysteine efflux transporter